MDRIHLNDHNHPELAPFRDARDADIARRHNAFLIEGRFAVESLLRQSIYPPRSLVLTEPALHAILNDAPDLPKLHPTLPTYILSKEAMSKLVGFNIHRGCIAAADRPTNPPTPEHLLTHADIIDPDRKRPIVALEHLANHDNVGGIFRAAAAFNAAAILISPQTCDPLYRKAVRVSMAAVLRLPFATAQPWPHALQTLIETHNLEPIALATQSPTATAAQLPHIAAHAARQRRRPLLIVGAEGPGLTTATRQLARHIVTIPITPMVDSLNATVATAIALHHLHTHPSSKPNDRVIFPP